MYSRFFKRLLDIAVALVALPFLCVLFVLVYPFIFLEDRGPLFYKGERMGKDGQAFKMYKFRTMKVNAPDLRNADGTTFNGKNDPRLTKSGHFLRVTSIDELPQLLNVLLGDMSLVGPRPDLVNQKELYSDCLDKLEKRVSVRPGITGYSQALYRNDLSLLERLEKDLFYVANVTFMLDVKIILWTAKAAVVGKGVYRDAD